MRAAVRITIAATLLLTLSQSARAAVKVLNIKVAPDISRVHVSWTGASGSTDTSFVVTSTPERFSCATMTTACDIVITDAVPQMSFQVSQIDSRGAVIAKSKPSRAIQTTRLLILAGSSIASGFGARVSDPSTSFNLWQRPLRSPADTQVRISWVGCGFNTKGDRLVPLSTPQYRFDPSRPIFGPEVGIARTLWAAGWRNMTVVKVTCPGSNLSRDWTPGSVWAGALVEQIDRVERLLKRSFTVPIPTALFWVQGHSDSTNLSEAQNYFSNLSSLLTYLRSTVVAATDTPIVLGVLDSMQWIESKFYTNGQCQTPTCQDLQIGNGLVRDADTRAANELPHVFAVETQSVPRLVTDSLHLTSRGQLELGTLLGQKLLEVTPS